MKNFTKLLAVILCLVVALSTAACSLRPQWSYKEQGSDDELPIGIYIYALYNAYNKAGSYARETESYNSETGLYNGEKSFLNVKITDDEGKTAVASQWIKEEAENTVKTLIAINKEYDRVGATIDEAKLKSQIKGQWNGDFYKNDPTYKQYYEMGYITADQLVLEEYGISYASYEYYNLTAYKEEAIFDKLYTTEGGEKAVADEDLKKFFTENYTSYTYFNTNLYTNETVEGSESETGALTTQKPMSEEEIKKNQKKFEGYANDLKGGKSIDDVVKAYKADFKLAEDAIASSTKVELTKEISAGDDIKKALESLKEGEATTLVVGEDTQKSLYLIYKSAIEKEVENNFSDKAKKDAIIVNMKGDEFKNYIENLTKNTKIEKSKFVDKYDPKMFEPKEEK